MNGKRRGGGRRDGREFARELGQQLMKPTVTTMRKMVMTKSTIEIDNKCLKNHIQRS
jgi:hypothetical protein